MSEQNCIFCKICNGMEPANIVFSDREVVVFVDIKPASDHHYLVVPKEHIPSVKDLKKDDIPLIIKLKLAAIEILEKNLINLKDARLGFHWPPFNSIKHLHLHVISPSSNMSYINKIIFLQNNLWFVNPDYLCDRLGKR